MIKKLINMLVYVLQDSANYVLSYDRDLDTPWNSPYDIV